VPDTGDTDIPIVWLSLEDAADNLILSAYGRISNATFDYRATRDVLALSLLLNGHTWGAPSHETLKSMRPYLTDGSRWWHWCSSNLEFALAALSPAETDLARNAVRWLTGARMLIDSTPSPACACSPHHGRRVGVRHARQIIDTALAAKP